MLALMSLIMISCPIGRGSGALIIHKYLEDNIDNYILNTFNPKLNFFPFIHKLLYNSKNIKLIHSTPDYSIFFKKKDIPLIITFHNYVLDPWMRQYSSYLQSLHYQTDLRLWTKLALKKATKVTAVSQFTADLVKQDLDYSGDLEVIHNGIDTDHFVPAKEKNKNDKEVKVFFSGNITKRKGAHWLPEIADKLDKHINIYYTAGLRTKKNLPKRYNLIPIGPVKFEDMPERYSEMDILLMPTVREGFGLAVAEAMACGLPVIASNCSAIPELLDHNKGGYLCEVGDVDTFANSINYLSNSPQLRDDMGKYNREKVEAKFELSSMIDEYKILFKRIENTKT